MRNGNVNLLLPGERRMVGGRSLDGGVWLDIDGRGMIKLRPDQAFHLASGIFRALGIEMDFGYDGPAGD